MSISSIPSSTSAALAAQQAAALAAQQAVDLAAQQAADLTAQQATAAQDAKAALGIGVPSSPAATSSSSVQAALLNLPLGG